jgi:hypothetical protein
MVIALSVEKMSIEEKIYTMENIWDDLCKNDNSIASPSWHEAALIIGKTESKVARKYFWDWLTIRGNIEKAIV